MTRKEAIKILMNTAWIGTEQDNVETAVYMAVEALEREGNDVLDRVLEIIDGFLELRFYFGDSAVHYIVDVDGLKDAVKALRGGEHAED